MLQRRRVEFGPALLFSCVITNSPNRRITFNGMKIKSKEKVFHFRINRGLHTLADIVSQMFSH